MTAGAPGAPRTRVARAALVVSLAAAVAPASAQLDPCASLSNARGYKVVLDGVRIEGVEDAVPTATELDLAKDDIETRLASLLPGGDGAAVRVHVCANRRPAGGEFGPNTLDELAAKGVLVETWAVLREGPLENRKLRVSHRKLNVVLVASRLDEGVSPPDTLVTASREFEDPAPTKLRSAVVEASSDLEPYVLAAWGIAQLRSGSTPAPYDVARASFCKAYRILAQRKARLELLAYVDALAIRAARAAIADEKYAGPLRQAGAAATASCGAAP